MDSGRTVMTQLQNSQKGLVASSSLDPALSASRYRMALEGYLSQNIRHCPKFGGWPLNLPIMICVIAKARFSVCTPGSLYCVADGKCGNLQSKSPSCAIQAPASKISHFYPLVIKHANGKSLMTGSAPRKLIEFIDKWTIFHCHV